MPGHVSELKWDQASDKVQRRLGKLVEFLVNTESEYQELVGLWTLHGNDDQLVANQLFGDATSSPVRIATAAEILMTQDLRAAMLEAHNIYTNSDLAAMRKMT